MSNRLFLQKRLSYRKDYQLIFAWFKYGNYLAITPFESHNKFKRLYPVFWSVLYVLLLIYVGERKYLLYSNLKSATIFDKVALDSAEVVTEFLLIQQVVYRCYCGRKNWENLVNVVACLEKDFSKSYDYFENDVKVWTIWMDIVLFHVLFFTVHAFDHWANWGDITGLTAYLIYRISCYNVLYTSIFVKLLATWLKNRYDFLKKNVEDFVNMTQNMIIFERSEKLKISQKLKNFEQLYRKLHTICQECNTLFGWTQFFLMIVTVVGILSGCNYGLPTRKEIREPKVIAINIIFPLIYIVSVFTIVLSFDKIETTGENLPKTCMLMYESSKSKELKETLYNLAAYTEGLRPKFHAAGFWHVNRNVLSALFTSILTYLIIVIQGHMSVT